MKQRVAVTGGNGAAPQGGYQQPPPASRGHKYYSSRSALCRLYASRDTLEREDKLIKIDQQLVPTVWTEEDGWKDRVKRWTKQRERYGQRMRLLFKEEDARIKDRSENDDWCDEGT